MVEIVLNDSQKQELAKDVHSLLSNEIEQVRKDASLTNKPYMKKKEACRYIGVSYVKFQEMVMNGLQSHRIGSMEIFSKQDIDEYIQNN